MANSRPVTNDKIYDLINSTRLELKGDIGNLQQQFTTLEAGRLTRAEGNINALGLDLQKAINTLNQKVDGVKTSGSVLNTKAAIIGSIFLVIFTAFASAMFYKLIVGAPK